MSEPFTSEQLEFAQHTARYLSAAQHRSPRLFAEIDGQPVALDTCDWVLWGPCGCPWGLTVGRYAPTEDDAWKALYDYKREIDKAKRQGCHLELMTHDRWCREVADRMKTGCPHPAKGRAS